MQALLANVNATIVWKWDSKGHDKSMNLIQELTRDYQYVLHMEDDWQFLHTLPYIAESVRVLESDPRIGQVLFNQDYQEDPDDPRDIIGSVPLMEGFRLHVWDPKHDMCKKRGQISNGHWPHYSLRPSVLRRSMWTHVGTFTEGHQEFEREYGVRYMQKGFRSVFFEGIHTLHLGKCSWETEDEHPSAYTLNGVSRFFN